MTAQRLVLNLVSEGDGPWVVLSHALGCDVSMYDAVAADLARDHQVLRYDHRGHGASQRVADGHSIDDLADDAAGLIAAKCGGQPVVFAGVSMGGMTAQALAARSPGLVRGVVIANSAQHYDGAAQTAWQQRIATVAALGTQAVADSAMERWFSAQFRKACLEVVSKARAVLEACDRHSYALACQAVMNIDTRDSNTRIACPALVIDGVHDIATPPALSDAIARQIPNAQRASLATGHLGATEDPSGFAELVRRFVARL